MVVICRISFHLKWRVFRFCHDPSPKTEPKFYLLSSDSCDNPLVTLVLSRLSPARILASFDE